MLKAIKHLSMNAMLLEVLQNANAIEILTRILDEQSSGPHSTARRYSNVLVLTTGFIHIPGNVKSCLPDVLQLVSIEQGQTGRGGAGRYHTATDARDRVEFTSQAVRPPYSLRPRQRWEELRMLLTAARWSRDVHQTSHGSLLPSQRSRVYSVMVRTLATISGPRRVD
jgi:hypothetical protein